MNLSDFIFLEAARPFEPFEIHTTGGKCIPVLTVDHFHVLRHASRVIVEEDNNTYHTVPFDQVASIAIQGRPLTLPTGGEAASS